MTRDKDEWVTRAHQSTQEVWDRAPLPLTDLGRKLVPTSADYASQLFDLLETTLAIGSAYGLMRVQQSASASTWRGLSDQIGGLLNKPTVGSRIQLVRLLDKHERGACGWTLSERCGDELTTFAEVVSPDQVPKRKRPPLATALQALSTARNYLSHPGSTAPHVKKILLDHRLFETAIKVLIKENELFSARLLCATEYGTLDNGRPGIRATSYSGLAPLSYADHAVIENSAGARPGQLFLTTPLLLHPLLQVRADELFVFWELSDGEPILRHPLSNEKIEEPLVGAFLDLAPAEFASVREQAAAVGWAEAVEREARGKKKSRPPKSPRRRKRKRIARKKERKPPRAVSTPVAQAAHPPAVPTRPAGPQRAVTGPMPSAWGRRIRVWLRTSVVLIALSLAALGGFALWNSSRAADHTAAASSHPEVGRSPTSTAPPSRRGPPIVEGSGCGELTADPSAIERLDDWDRWRCKEEGNVSRRIWASCLRHGHYDGDQSHGCPGEERCCPPDVDSAWRQEEAIRRLIRSHCGHPRAHHRDRFANWDSYRCRARSEVDRPTWQQCLGRSEYSNQVGRGCIEGMLCCPVEQ